MFDWNVILYIGSLLVIVGYYKRAVDSLEQNDRKMASSIDGLTAMIGDLREELGFLRGNTAAHTAPKRRRGAKL